MTDITEIGLGIIMGAFIMSFIFIIYEGIVYSDTIRISQETADDICKNLTNSSIVEAKTNSEGKLICEVPSYDHTTNIIIKPTGQDVGE